MRKMVMFTCLMMALAAAVCGQTKEISGQVIDSVGSPIPGASVNIKGNKRGTSADSYGNFKLTVPQDVTTLVVSAIGHTTQDVDVTHSSTVKIQLSGSNSGQLEEVVVTSLGIKREKRTLTYSTQEIKADALITSKQDNVVNDLAGKVSGVQITNSSGMPGSSARVVIRGAVSLTGQNQPLFVVDGVPVNNDEAGAIDAFGQGADNVSLNQGSTSNRAIDIDPNIIESVNILKGAAATALYGSAAATGAIIITTKNGGKASKPQVSVSSSYAIANPIFYPFQDKWAQGLGGEFIDGNGPDKTSASWGPSIDSLISAGIDVKRYNQQKLFFRTGHTSDNNVSVSGGTDKSRYLVSYSFLTTDGIMRKTDFTRHSFFSKFTNQLSDKFNVNVQFNYINSENNRLAEGNGLASPLWTVYAAPPTWNPLPSTDSAGDQRLYRSLARNNPYFLLDNTGFVSDVNRFLPVASLVYTPTSWLSITERLGADIYADQSGYFESEKVVNGFFNNNGGVTNRVQNFRQFNNDLIVDFHKDLTSDLYGSFILGANLFSQYSRTNTQTGQGVNVANFYNISNMTTIIANDFLSKYRKTGFYVQANFDYRKMLFLALTGRYDGSSVLAQSKNYYPYGSVGLGFAFTELMQPNPKGLTFGKVRISYSVVGNDDLLPYSLSTPFTQATGTANNISYPFNGYNGFVLSNVLGNSTLKNEKLGEFETGVELRFFNNRLSFEGSYFDRKTTDLLTPVPIGPSSGFYKYNLNAGSIQNKGIELQLSGTPIKSDKLTWEVSANFTRIRNKVLKLAPNVSNIQFGGFGGGGGIYAFADQPYGVIYGSQYLRDPQGNIIVGDVGSGIDGIPIKGDNGPLGNINPDFLAGLFNSFTYGGITLNFLFDWKKGGQIYNLDDHYNWFYGTTKNTEDRSPHVVKGVYSDGKENVTQISAEDYFRNVSDIDEAVIEDATFIKLRSLGISYTVSQGKLKSSVVKGLTVSLTGTNLWIYRPHYTGSDPETSLQGSGNGQGVVNYLTPTTRNFIIGFRLQF